MPKCPESWQASSSRAMRDNAGIGVLGIPSILRLLSFPFGDSHRIQGGKGRRGKQSKAACQILSGDLHESRELKSCSESRWCSSSSCFDFRYFHRKWSVPKFSECACTSSRAGRRSCRRRSHAHSAANQATSGHEFRNPGLTHLSPRAFAAKGELSHSPLTHATICRHGKKLNTRTT